MNRWTRLLLWAAASRVLVLATAVVMHWLRAPRGRFGAAMFAHPFGILESWDGLWYRVVAERGYLLVPGRQSDPAFFPLFPTVLRALHGLGLSYPVSAVVISNLAFLVAVVVFYELGRAVLPDEDARRAALLVAIFPMSFVFSMAYPESLVFAALSLALLFAIRGRWLACAVAGSIAALGRPEALFYAMPIAAVAVRRWPRLSTAERGTALGAAVAPAASFATFPLYLAWSLHNVYAWSWAERGWGRSFKLDGLVRAFTGLGSLAHDPWLVRDAAFAAVYLALLGVARRAGVGWPWIVAGAAIVLLPLTSGSFASDARFGLLALPAYWGLAVVARRPQLRVPLVVLSVGLLVAGTATIPFAYP